MRFSVFQALLTALGVLNISQKIHEQLFYIERDLARMFQHNRPLNGQLQFLQEVLIAANEIGFCVFPAYISTTKPFIEEYLNANGFDKTYHSTVDINRYKEGFKHIYIPTDDKIPYITHMVWLTHSDHPKEMIRQVDLKQKGYEFHLNVTIKTLKKYNFTITLWVNSVELIPRTKQWADTNGILVRELKEFDGVEEYKSIMDEIYLSIEQKKFAQGADIARLLIMYVYGGVYADQDHQIMEYDPMLNKMNLFFYYTENIGYNSLENSLFGASPKNIFILKYLMTAISNRQGQTIPYCESICLQKSHFYILFETGPFLMSRVFDHLLINGDLNDQLYLVLDPSIAHEGYESNNSTLGLEHYDLVFNDKTHRLKVRFKHYPSASWIDAKREKALFGWQK
ncbi:UNKNOWN [Stylonychia lemnae]|uniref:Uncharacterized protein n=1 Tax=Stylonychia lemnae TaxID=5949 RepID=A0A078AVG7_STYLE|nr:UNKNOWN [Stylonychia lemnae]|eukprot:CDW86179.1 UNKNOWN [Stylonychia lemnae]